MRRNSAENIVLYYKAIPGMVKLLKQERTELEGEYDSLRGTSYDGMPYGSTPGKPTEALAIRWHMGAWDDAVRGGSRCLDAAMEFSPFFRRKASEANQEKRREKPEPVAQSGGKE